MISYEFRRVQYMSVRTRAATKTNALASSTLVSSLFSNSSLKSHRSVRLQKWFPLHIDDFVIVGCCQQGCVSKIMEVGARSIDWRPFYWLLRWSIFKTWAQPLLPTGTHHPRLLLFETQIHELDDNTRICFQVQTAGWRIIDVEMKSWGTTMVVMTESRFLCLLTAR